MPIIFIVLLFTASLFTPIHDEPVISVIEENQETFMLPLTPPLMEEDREAEQAMLELLNEARQEAGLKEFVWDEKLAQAAQDHSQDMWEKKYFAHESPDGENAVHRMLEAGAEFRKAGENLALTRTVERAHEGLMESEGHRRNILDPEFTRVGIGVVDGGLYGKMFTQNFAD